MPPENLFQIRDLRRWYAAREGGLLSSFSQNQRHLKAVDDVDFEIRKGEILGLAGQSGCGKSTLGELLVGLDTPTNGEIRFKGEDMTDYTSSQMKEFRKHCQIIFQDPYEALNPRFPVSRLVSEPLVIHRIGTQQERDERVLSALEDAGLRPPEKYLDQVPSELSGGERQRVCIARALVLNPEFLVADEPVSMLDVSVRSSILNLFKKLQEKRDLTMLYISHDLSTISYLADRTMIMYLGDVVEIGPTTRVIHDPAHPYTESLLGAVPTPDPDTQRAGSKERSEVPNPIDLPDGCRYHPHCEYATEECVETEPRLEDRGSDHRVACYHPVNPRDE